MGRKLKLTTKNKKNENAFHPHINDPCAYSLFLCLEICKYTIPLFPCLTENA